MNYNNIFIFVGSTIPKAMKTLTAPVLDVGWHDDGTKAFIAGADRTWRVWDLAADQMMQVAAHENAVKTCHWIKAPNYSCLMTGNYPFQSFFLQKKEFWMMFNYKY